MKKLNNREEKINYLKALAAGKASLEDLEKAGPQQVQVWRQIRGTDTYSNKEGEVFTREQIAERNKGKRKKNRVCVFVTYNKIELPLFHSEAEAEKYLDYDGTPQSIGK